MLAELSWPAASVAIAFFAFLAFAVWCVSKY